MKVKDRIIEAMRVCTDGEYTCRDCPRYEKYLNGGSVGCYVELVHEAADTIESQQKRIVEYLSCQIGQQQIQLCGRSLPMHGTGGLTMEEKRLIDANALKVKEFPDPDSGEGLVYTQDIDEAPTVDAVEVPPIKLGDTAYFIINGKIYSAEICLIQWSYNRYGIQTEIRGEVQPYHTVSASFSDWGKTIFANKEEAEKVLYFNANY